MQMGSALRPLRTAGIGNCLLLAFLGTASLPAAPQQPSAAKATVPARAPQPTMQPSAARWPHTMSGAAGTAVVYQPQVIAWPDRQRLETRIAVALTPKGAKAPVLGTIDVSFATETDLATRSVAIADPKLTSSRFPTSDTAQATRFEQSIKEALAAMETKRYPLDTILLSLPSASAAPTEVAVKNDPPTIFVSARG